MRCHSLSASAASTSAAVRSSCAPARVNSSRMGIIKTLWIHLAPEDESEVDFDLNSDAFMRAKRSNQPTIYSGSTPMIVREQVPLAPLTTLGVGGPARYFAEARTESDVREAVEFARSRDLAAVRARRRQQSAGCRQWIQRPGAEDCFARDRPQQQQATT